MIEVRLESEPATFDALVRQKGLGAIAEMVGKSPPRRRPGRRRAKIADHESDIPADKFPPFWRAAIPDLLMSYSRRCAFLALYLEHATSTPTVDHMLPKSRHWAAVYEWSNFRLCAASINSQKSDLSGIIDPFDCRDGWFALELVGFQVVIGPALPAALRGDATTTLEILNLPEFRRAREAYVNNYSAGEISLGYLQVRAPFVVHELRRQGRLRPGDA